MGDAAATTTAALTEIRSAVDLLHGRIAVIDTTQQSLVTQLGLIADAVQEGAKMNSTAARQLAMLDTRLDAQSQAMERLRLQPPSPDENDPDPDACKVTGKSTLRPTQVAWTSDAPGAPSAAQAAYGRGEDPAYSRASGDGVRIPGGTGFRGGCGAGGGLMGGVGGGGFGEAGGGRNNSSGDSSSKHHLKMSFPRFDGDQPRVWKDKCLDYFRLFNVHPSLWLISATLHMDGNAALWLKAYRLRHEVNTWPALMTAVEEKFGADDHRKFMKQLLSLKQKGTVEEYQLQFESLSYQLSIQNPHYDEQFFVSQFIRGLKSEIRGAVEAQVPETVERAILLALVQQEVLADAKPWGQRQLPYARAEPVAPRIDAVKPALKLGNGDLWRDRQLRDYRRTNGLCFKCGDKYDPTHQCTKKQATELNALEAEEAAELLSEEVLNMMELQDMADAKELSLSLNAIAGKDASETIRLRALVDNQVLIILIDSGSSGSFINANLVSRLRCSVQKTTPVTVKLPNEQFLSCDSVVPDFTWWTQGETFHTPMRVLNIGAYDAILGVDWLKRHGPIKGDWVTKKIKVSNAGKRVWLQGVVPTEKSVVRELPIEQLAKWTK